MPAHPHHQRSVPLDEYAERSLIIPQGKRAEQLAIGRTPAGSSGKGRSQM
jgi:hypothetical protein